MIATVKPRMDSSLAKKKTSSTSVSAGGRINPSELRIQTLKVSDLQSLVDDARHWLTVTDGILHDCRQNHIEEITMDGATKLERAVELLTTFSSYAFRGANQALSEKRRNQSSTPKPASQDDRKTGQ